MRQFDDWAARHGVPPAAMLELAQIMGAGYRTPLSKGCDPGSEADVSLRRRLDAQSKGGVLWRNNVGACVDKSGRPIRFGLANDSEKVNRRIKSADLIGLTQKLITPGDVGRVIGVFTAEETKREGWVYTGTERERAQLKFLLIVSALGGIARFTTGE